MRIVVARMPAPCGAASCLDPRSPESSLPRRPFRFHVPEDASPQHAWPQHILPNEAASGPVRAERSLQAGRTPPRHTHCHIPFERILHGRPQRIRPARRAQRRPGGIRAGVQACRHRFVGRCSPGVIHRHHSRFPPSVIVSADGRRDRSPVRASIIGPRLVARFPARTGADILDNSQHDNSRHKVTRRGIARPGTSRHAHGMRPARRQWPRCESAARGSLPVFVPGRPGLSIHRGGRPRFTHTAPSRPPVRRSQGQRIHQESTNQLGKADT